MIHFAHDYINDFKRFTLIKKVKFFILSVFFLLSFFVSLKIYVFAERRMHNLSSDLFSVKGQYNSTNNMNYYEDSIVYSGCEITIQVNTSKQLLKNNGYKIDGIGPNIAYVSENGSVLGNSKSGNGNDLSPTRTISNVISDVGSYLVSYFLHLDWDGGDDDVAYGYKTFTVTPISMSGTISFNNLTYDGNKKIIEIPEQQITGAAGNMLKPQKDKDYTVAYEYKQNDDSNFAKITEDYIKNAGIYKVTLNFKGNYSGQRIGTFTINEKFVSDGTNNDIRLDNNTVEYNGTRQEPRITSVTIDGVTATSDDYTVDYGGYDMKSVGHHVGTLTFKNNFEGAATFGYDITKKNASNAVVSFTENGPGTEPSYTVCCDGMTLKPNDDFDAEWFGDENLTMPANFSIEGDKFLKLNFKGNYKNGEEDSSPPIVRSYNKDNLNASDAEVTIDMDNLTYDGQEHKPSIQSVYLNGEQLSSDYYTYSWNTDDFTSAGKKTLNVIFTNGYQGSKPVDFEIYQKDASSSEVNLSQDSFVYDETVKKASVESIKLGELVLDNSDYTVSFPDTDYVNAGKKTMIINYKGNFKGQKILEYEIKQNDHEATISLDQSSVVYDGTSHYPEISVFVDNKEVPTSNYTVSWDKYDFISAGNKNLTINLNGNYSGSAGISYSITPQQIDSNNDVEVTLSQNEFSYNSKEQKPSIESVKLGDLILTKEKDYDIVWENPDKNDDGDSEYSSSGTKKFKLEFKGNFSGSKTVEYEIKKLDASSCTVNLSQDEFAYNSKEQKTSVESVTYGDLTLTENDYDISWTSDNYTSPGDKSLTLNFKGNYAGEKTVRFKILSKNASDANVELFQNSFIYNSQEQKPFVSSVQVDDDVLINARDYTVQWNDEDYSNAGKKSLTLKFKGNYSGGKTVDFEILPKDASLSVIELSQTDFPYNSEEQKPDIERVVLGDLLLTENDYDILWNDSDYINSGDKSLTLKFKGNYTGEKSLGYKISPKDASSADTDLSHNIFIYNSEEQKPFVSSVKMDDLILTNEKDYDMVWNDEDYSISGKKSLSLKFKGNYSGEKTIGFEILPKDASLSLVELSQTEFQYNSEEQKPKVNNVVLGDLLISENDYDIFWNDGDYINSGDKSLTLKFKGNYSGEKTTGFKITPKDSSSVEAKLSENSFLYNSAEQKPLVTSVKIGDEILTNEKDFDIVWNNDNYANAGKDSLTLKFKGNYSGEKTIDFEIVPKDASLSVIELSQTDFIFNGEEQRPTVSRVILGDLLLSDEDYDIFWDDGDYINSGDKSLTLKFKGNYSGERTTSFKISPMDSSSVEVELSQDSFTYNSEEQKPLVTSVRIGDSLLTNEKDYDILWDEEDYTNAGYKTLTLKFKGNYSGEKILHYTINNGTDDSENTDGDKTNNYKNTDNTEQNYTPNNVVVDWRSTWGVPVDKFGITHYLLDGETSVEVTDYGKVWLYEESAGTGAWYCLDNSDGVFKIGSKFTVEWLKKSENPEKYEKELSKLDGYRKKRIDEDKAELFLTYVTDPDGHRYTNFGKDSAGTDISVKFYVQIGDDWDKDDIRALYLSSSEDEIVEAYFTNFESPEGKNEDFACLNLKHFSTYLVYDEEILNSEVPDESEQKEEYNSPDSRILNSTGTIVNTSSSENLLKLCIFIVMLLGSTFQIFKFKIRKKVEL